MARDFRIGAVLSLARRKGYLKPAYQPDECFVDIINNANQLLILVQKSNGLMTSELAERSGLPYNICLIYLRELLALNFVLKNRFTKEATWSFRDKKEEEIKSLEQEVSLELIK